MKATLEDGDASSMLELRGGGAVVLESTSDVTGLEVATGRGVRARPSAVAGWIGALTVRPLPARDAPAGETGLVIIEGDGVLLLFAR